MKISHKLNKKTKLSFKAFSILAILTLGASGIIYSIEAYPETFKTAVSLSETQKLRPMDPIIISFSQPVLVKIYAEALKAVPELPINFHWEDQNRKLIIQPKNFWKPGTGYAFRLPEGRSIMLTKIEPIEIKFSTLPYPKVEKFYPAKEAKDVTLDIEDPLVVNFQESAKDFFIKFSINPFSQVAYQINDDRTEFKLLPQAKIEEGKKFEVKISAKYINDPEDNFKEIFSSTFETLPAKPQEFSRDFSQRIEEAKKFTEAKIASGKYIDVNLKSQILSIFENGKPLDSFLISSGKRGMDTPSGEFKIYNKYPRAWSKKYGLYMPYWMAFIGDGSRGFHELPEWPGGYKEGANHLGIPVSHGCVRLGIGPAEKVYNWAEVGTPVIIY
ncbi:MAG: L,D-transpeptidase [Candidatus Moranbacteria bacterium]|nr:L,D-transpeptidase [Candidatus Moranbacteria bacterium]